MHPLATVCCARLPVAALPALAALRTHQEVRLCQTPEWLWLFWPAGEVAVALVVAGIPQAMLLCQRGEQYYALGQHLPTFEVPDVGQAVSLSRCLFPKLQVASDPEPPGWTPVRLRLIRDDTPRPTTLLRLSVSALLGWAELATTQALAGVQVSGHGEQVLLRGQLPPVMGERFWGQRVLCPAGFRPEPAIPETVLIAALNLPADSLALLDAGGVECLAATAWGPLTRAGLRQWAGGARHAS
jgi:hypothetical protein